MRRREDPQPAGGLAVPAVLRTDVVIQSEEESAEELCACCASGERGERGDSWRGIGNCALWKGFGETSLGWRSRISSKSVKSRMRRYSV